MQKLTLSLLCAGLLTTTAIAEDICAGAFLAQNFEQSAQCYVQQLKKEKSLYNHIMAGKSYCEQGHYKEALPYLKEAEKKAKTPDDYRTVYNWMGSVYGRLGDTKQELAYEMKDLDLSLKSENRNNIGTAYGNLGGYYYKQNQLQKALEFFQKALEYNKESESSATYGNMAIAYNDLENFPKAEEMYQKSITIDQNTGDYLSLGAHKTQLGGFYFGQKRNSEARAMLEDAITMTHKSGNINSEADALSILSVIDYREGSASIAKERAAEGLRLAKQSGSSVALSNANWAWKIVNGN